MTLFTTVKPSQEFVTIEQPIRNALAMLIPAGAVFEVRALEVANGRDNRTHTEAGFFNDIDKAAACAARLDGTAKGIYITLNSVHPDMLGLANNQVKWGKSDQQTKDKNIVRRVLLGIDTDPHRDISGVSSTDAEHNAALERALNIREWLTSLGWSQPVYADSGNGGHLVYRIDLPCEYVEGKPTAETDDATELVKRVLKAIWQKFSDMDEDGGEARKGWTPLSAHKVGVDLKVFNPSRIWKLYGTMARKGETMEHRPHRRSCILDAPAELQLVTREQLEQVAALYVSPEKPPQASPAVSAVSTPRRSSQLEKRARAYCEKVLDEAETAIRNARPGEIHNVVFREVAAAANFIGQGQLDEFEVRDRLLSAAMSVSSDSTDAKKRKDVEDAIEAGRKDPKDAAAILLEKDEKAGLKRQAAVHAMDEDAALPDNVDASGEDFTMDDLPNDYVYDGEELLRVRKVGGGEHTRTEYDVVYPGPGRLKVVGYGPDVFTGEYVLTVEFSLVEGGRKRYTLPRSDLSKPGMIRLGNQGAAIDDTNAPKVAHFLNLYIAHNHDNREYVPLTTNASKFGVAKLSEGQIALVTPLRAIGSDGLDVDIRHTGKYGDIVDSSVDDIAAYVELWEAARNWNAPVFWLHQAASIASPAIYRMKFFRDAAVREQGIALSRSPVINAFGDGSGGKTTSIYGALGLWGDPLDDPLSSAFNSTLVGLMDSVRDLNGLPLFLDDVHARKDPSDVLDLIYYVANGKERKRGKVGHDLNTNNSHTTGGRRVGGTLFTAGEASFPTKYGGIENRILQIDTNKYFPLGAPAKSGEGKERASLVEKAYTRSPGAIGPYVYTNIFANWGTFVQAVGKNLQQIDVSLDKDWREIFAVYAMVLREAFQLLAIDVPNTFVDKLVRDWSEMLVGGRQDTDSAADAWLSFCGAFANSTEYSTESGWTVRKNRDGDILACKLVGDKYWRVPTSKASAWRKIFDGRIVQLYGRKWLSRNWVMTEDKDGKTTTTKTLAGGGSDRCLLVLPEALDQSGEDADALE